MLRPATIEDAFALAPRLREADRIELQAQGFLDMDVILAESIVTSEEAWTFAVDGQVHAVMGVVNGGKFGIPWMLGSDALFDHQKALLRLPWDYIPRWLQRYGFLMNVVHTENHRSIRWLKRLGFVMGEPFQEPGGTFQPFSMSATPCADQQPPTSSGQ